MQTLISRPFTNILKFMQSKLSSNKVPADCQHVIIISNSTRISYGQHQRHHRISMKDAKVHFGELLGCTKTHYHVHLPKYEFLLSPERSLVNNLLTTFTLFKFDLRQVARRESDKAIVYQISENISHYTQFYAGACRTYSAFVVRASIQVPFKNHQY